MTFGHVSLVGAGPGDEDLISVKGLEYIREADVILYDRLVHTNLLHHIKKDCELIYCGKYPNRHVLRQEGINEQLVLHAKKGKRVVRLKGGDPSIFGRVGEEAAVLREHNISYDIVPGITSGVAASTYAGITVTHREHAGSVAFVTAHDQSKSGEPTMNWEHLAKGVDTIVFYMGIRNLAYLSAQLITAGRSTHTPVAVIQWGTYGRQRVVKGTLETIAEDIKIANVTNPAITVVGEVVALRDDIAWFETQSLFGKQILLVEKEEENVELKRALKAEGAEVLSYPRWNVTKRSLSHKTLHMLVQAAHLHFATTTSVCAFFEAIKRQRIDIRTLQATLSGENESVKRVIESYHIVPADAVEQPTFILCEASEATQYGTNSIVTHERTIDERFQFLLQRALEETNVTTILFAEEKLQDVYERYITPYIRQEHVSEMYEHTSVERTLQLLKEKSREAVQR